ncbi:MAG: MATE family efflux transporter [Lachnospiraceae bacterium]|nr:MATE family efflux transporter [Lachnospiraceae bacterium]
MKKRDVYKKALFLAVPMMIQNGITNAVGLVDNVMVGSLGTESMTAVSIVVQLIFVFNLSVFGGLSGPGIYGAQYYGQGNQEGVRNVFRIKLWIGAFCMLVGTLVFATLDTALIGLYLHGNDAGIDSALTVTYAKQYLQIMIFNIFPFVITQVYAGSLRETGESFKPMIAGVCSVIVDIVLNYILIYGKFGFPRLEVRGAAVATVAARVVEMAIIIIWAHAQKRKHTFLQGVYRTIKVPVSMVKEILKKSIPIYFNEFLWAGGIAALTQCYSLRGLSVVAGMNISNALCNLLNVVFVAMGNAVGILSGQLLGAGKYKEAKANSMSLMWFTGGLCVLLTLLLVSISGVFPLLYDTSDEVRKLGGSFIVITALFFPVQGCLNALYFTLRSGGKTFVTFLFDSVYSWVVTVPIAWLLCNLTSLPILTIYAIVQSADIIKLLVGYVLIQKGIWITNLVEEK